MRKSILLAVAGLVVVVGCVAGCGTPSDKYSIPVNKWKGAPYRISFDTTPPKQKPAGIYIPVVKYTANPDALERRGVLIVRFHLPGAKYQGQEERRIIGTAVDISGTDGGLPADYMDRASKGIESYLEGYCVDGKITLNVAIARSSLNPQASGTEIHDKLLSDWIPLDVVAKKPHGKKC